MTSFIAKSILEELNIDTIERKIVFALLLLRNAATQSEKTGKYYNAIRLSVGIRATGDTYQANLNATAKIPYHSLLALTSGMNLIKNLKTISDSTIMPSFSAIAPTMRAPQLPEEPSFINTLEKHLLWSSQILAASILPVIDRVKISFLEEDPSEPSVLIDYLLPIDWSKYLLTNNIIEATKLLAARYISEPIEEIPLSTLIGNDSGIDNLFLVGN
jgi:hypothetical protein